MHIVYRATFVVHRKTFLHREEDLLKSKKLKENSWLSSFFLVGCLHDACPTGVTTGISYHSSCYCRSPGSRLGETVGDFLLRQPAWLLLLLCKLGAGFQKELFNTNLTCALSPLCSTNYQKQQANTANSSSLFSTLPSQSEANTEDSICVSFFLLESFLWADKVLLGKRLSLGRLS